MLLQFDMAHKLAICQGDNYVFSYYIFLYYYEGKVVASGYNRVNFLFLFLFLSFSRLFIYVGKLGDGEGIDVAEVGLQVHNLVVAEELPAAAPCHLRGWRQ